jgi:predicted nucleotidyltransferase
MVRLIEEEKNAIVKAILKQDNTAEIYLFGSRTDINKKGGDTDILIVSDKIKKDRLTFIEWEIFKLIDEQKIDFIISQKNISDAFVRMIIEKGVLLC